LGADFDPDVVVVGPEVVVFEPIADGQAVALEVAEVVEVSVSAMPEAADLAAVVVVALLGVERPKETFSKLYRENVFRLTASPAPAR